ncbi:ricin-type beta-trefoil lectin domain protein [Streptomyces sp. NPDC059759]|uniref:ricin-type beta-trefoil lectin domain protein n=1 Tax=unclassified Streptomyces TaxID=2593676 RepID=UPI00364C1A66
MSTLAPEPSPAVTSAEPRRTPHPGPASDSSPAPDPEQASSSVPEPGAGSDVGTGDTLVPGAAAASDTNSAESGPGSDPNPGSNSTPGPGSTSSLGESRPGRLSRLPTTRATTSAPARGGADTDAAQPERSARLIGTVAAVSVLAALGLGTVAFMAVPGGDDTEPSAAHVEDAAVPTVGPDGSVLPSRSASPFPSARGHRSGDEPGKKPHVGKGGAKKGSSTSPDGQGPHPEHAPAAHDGKAVEAASPHKAGTKPATTQQSDSKPAADSGTKPAAGDLIVGYASSRCVGVSAHKGSDGSPLALQGCGGDAWQKWVFASDGSVRSMGLCMDIATASASNGAGIQLAHCNGGWAQKFNLNGSHDLVNTTIGKCVDAKDSGTSAGTRLQLWDCGGTSNQKWHLG